MSQSIGYTRISKSDSSSISLDMQSSKIHQYASLKSLPDLTIISDDGQSGKDLHRPGAQILLDLLNNGSVEHLIIYRLDRLSRSVKDTIDIAEILKSKGVQLHSLCEQIDTSTPIGEFFFTVMAALNQFERKLTGERVSHALRQKQADGLWVGRPPLGYRSLGKDDPKKKGVLEEVKFEQAAIRRAKKLKKEDPYITIRELAREVGIDKSTLHRALRRDVGVNSSRSLGENRGGYSGPTR